FSIGGVTSHAIVPSGIARRILARAKEVPLGFKRSPCGGRLASLKEGKGRGPARDASAYGVARGGLSPFARTEGRCACSRRPCGSWAFRPSVCRFSVSAY